MPDSSDFWYRVGYALESARRGRTRASLDSIKRRAVATRDGDHRPASADKDEASRDGVPERLTTMLLGRGDDRRGAPSDDDDATSGALDLLLAAGTGTAVSRLLAAWPARRRPTVVRLLRAAAAGASATLLRELLEPLIRGRVELPRFDEGTADRLTAGAARGLIYGGVLDPRLPGPPMARGVAFAAAEYLLSPWGGLRAVLGRHAPYRKLPVLSQLLDDPEAGEEAFLDHLVFGVALGLLYGEEDGGVSVRMGIGSDDL